MSKKGQDNQRGINFQNKVALLYLLNSYRSANFKKIQFEDNKFEDFTLFFTDPIKHFTFFDNFEIKNWANPLSLNDVKKIIKKEAEKGINRYQDKSSFFIVAPSFKEECKEIEFFKKKCFFNLETDFEKVKKTYKIIYPDNYILNNWSREEILSLKHIYLVELKEENIKKMITDWFYYEEFSFYPPDNLDNIINLFTSKITSKSSYGKSLKYNDIKNILSNFLQNEANKSESYDLSQDLASVIDNIEDKLKTEDLFETLNDNKYIMPISTRTRAIYKIVDKLKEKKFKLEKIKWFFEKLLIKHCYFYQCLELLEQYIEINSLTTKDIKFILEFIFKIYKANNYNNSLPNYKFDNWHNSNKIFELLFKICNNQEIPEQFKSKIINFLDNAIPDWQKKEFRSYTWDSYNYQDIPDLVENLSNYSKEGLKFMFKKYNFTRCRDSLTGYNGSYYNYIKNFINKDFKKKFPLVVENLSNQFQRLYKSYGYESDFYKGYEIMGSTHFTVGNDSQLYIIQLESVFSECICEFYKKTKNWKYLEPFIYSECDKNNPVFVKRSFIPFLLNQIIKSSEGKLEDNKFYMALEFILKIKKGFPRTEDILVNDLRLKYPNIKDNYLEKLIEIILYKYSQEGITYDTFTLQFLFELIEKSKMSFKEHLKRILLNETFKESYEYEQTLESFASKMKTPNINNFFNEIKDKLDLSKNKDLLYRSVFLELQTKPIEKTELFRLFKSSKKEDLDRLASIISKDLWNAQRIQLLEYIFKLMKEHLNLKEFYKSAEKSDYLKGVIAQLAENAIGYDINLSEKIIELCLEDTNLCGESEKLHKEVVEGKEHCSISTMRAHLCFAIDRYIRYIIKHQGEADRKDLKKLEKAFSWTKILIDLDGSLSDKIEGFPRPNYYLRVCAIIPLINLSHHQIRNKLNNFKTGLGDEIKKFAFSIIEKTKEEVEQNQYSPFELFKRISRLFYYIKDLNEKEASQFLSFIECFRIPEANHFFIYYALFREKYFKEKGVFNSKSFKKILENICKGNPDILKKSISFTIYKSVEDKKEGKEPAPDFKFFEQIKGYWVLLFDNINKDMYFSLFMTLSFVLNNKIYYRKYINHFFQLINERLKNPPYDFSMHLDKVLPAISKNNPDDLVKTLFLFLDKGDSVSGDIPFSYDIRTKLIPEIKKLKNKISQNDINQAEQTLKKFNLSLKD